MPITRIIIDQNTLQSAIHGIKTLRHENELLGAQVSVLNIFAAALGLRRSEGAGVDVCWQIEQAIKGMEE